jgi:hypothetical protein
MRWLTEDAILLCAHITGKVNIAPSQTLVRIDGRRVLVATDPEAKSIAGCSNAAPPSKPCLTTLRVEAGYSDLLTIEGRRVCLDTVTGKTDGTPPGTVYYSVRDPGQALVDEGAG